MLAKIPVVNTNLPTGVPFVSIDNKTGITVPPKNSDALSRAINYLLQNPELARAMGQNGKKRVEQMFSLDKMLQEIEKIYGDLIKN